MTSRTKICCATVTPRAKRRVGAWAISFEGIWPKGMDDSADAGKRQAKSLKMPFAYPFGRMPNLSTNKAGHHKGGRLTVKQGSCILLPRLYHDPPEGATWMSAPCIEQARRFLMTPRLLIAGVAVFLLGGCATGTAASQSPQDPSPGAVATDFPAAKTADPIAPTFAGAIGDSASAGPAPELSSFAHAIQLSATTHSTSQQARETVPPARGGKVPVAKVPVAVNVDSPANAPTPVADAKPTPPTTALEAFDSQLVAVTRNADVAREAFTSLPADERDLLSAVIDSLARFRVALSNPGGLLADKTAPLIDLADELNARAPLSLPVVALCSEVTQFGVYDPIEPPSFIAGRETPTIVYCEVDHFRSEPTEDRHWRTRLTYEAVLYSGSDPTVSIITRKPAGVVDLCRNRRRDFFLADRLTIPASLPVGRYVLKITVVDELANRVAEATIPITLAAQ